MIPALDGGTQEVYVMGATSPNTNPKNSPLSAFVKSQMNNQWMEDPQVREWSRKFPGMRNLPPTIGTSEHSNVLDSIHAKQETIKAIENDIDRLLREIAQCRALITPARAIPLEILSRIFSVEEYWYPVDAKVILQLSMVSRQWNATAIGTPNIWTKIKLGISGKKVPKFRAKDLKLWIARAKGMPLTIHIHDVVVIPTPIQRLIIFNASTIGTISYEGFYYSYREDNPTKVKFYQDILKGSRNLKYLKDSSHKFDIEPMEIPSLETLLIQTQGFRIKAPNAGTVEVQAQIEINDTVGFVERICQCSPEIRSLLFQKIYHAYKAPPASALIAGFTKLQTLDCIPVNLCLPVLRGAAQTLQDLRVSRAVLSCNLPVFPFVRSLLLYRLSRSDTAKENSSDTEVEYASRMFPTLANLALQEPPQQERESDRLAYTSMVDKMLRNIIEMGGSAFPDLAKIQTIKNSWETVVATWLKFSPEQPGQMRPSGESLLIPKEVGTRLTRAMGWPEQSE
jgi:hypothetical protein